ncbi:MAG: prepilin-type N-terminal cleavage/methylation domain-containing protein, partial [Pseudomonadota bacterium]
NKTMIKLNARLKSTSGFTLLELLLVLAIIASVAAMSIAYLTPANRQISLKRISDVVTFKVRQARTKAMLQLSASKLFISLNPNAIWIEGEESKSFVFPADTELGVTTARSHAGQDLAAIIFFPDGTSSGGEILLRRENKAIAIKIDWVTGGPHVAN